MWQVEGGGGGGGGGAWKGCVQGYIQLPFSSFHSLTLSTLSRHCRSFRCITDDDDLIHLAMKAPEGKQAKARDFVLLVSKRVPQNYNRLGYVYKLLYLQPHYGHSILGGDYFMCSHLLNGLSNTPIDWNLSVVRLLS